jgi:hypothetical protein
MKTYPAVAAVVLIVGFLILWAALQIFPIRHSASPRMVCVKAPRGEIGVWSDLYKCSPPTGIP